MSVGCPFITCAVKKKGIDFCWECGESNDCKKWRLHRDASKISDSFKCYQTLEADISFVLKNGIEEFEKKQKDRELILKTMLDEFNNGRSKSYYCIASSVLEIDELHNALRMATEQTKNMEPKQKTKILHSILDQIAKEKVYLLKLRK